MKNKYRRATHKKTMWPVLIITAALCLLLSINVFAAPNTAKVRALWDATNLYLAFEITDSQIENPVTDPWSQDAIELYIDAGHNMTTTIDADDYLWIITAANVATPYYTAVGKTIQKAVTVTGSGYIVEMAIPWAQINQSPIVGKIIGALFANDEMDGGVTLPTFDWKNIASGGYARPNLWGDLTLSNTEACATTPTLTVAPTSLAFGNVTINTAPADKTYLLMGSNLTANVTVTAQTGYTVSTASGGPFAATATVTQVSGSVNQTIYVRFRPTVVQAYNSNITNASTGATTKNVAMTGAGIGVPVLTAAPTSLAYGNVTINTSPADKTYLLTGSYLTANVTVTAQTGYTVSTASGGPFAATATVTQVSGSVNQTIYVRFRPTVVQAYNSNITNASTGATTQNVALTGAGIAGTDASVAKKATGAITINGTLSECDWANANYSTITNATYSNNTMKVRTMWDNTNLYVAYEITDSQIENPAVPSWEQDGIELYLDASHNMTTTIEATDDYQWIITAANVVDPYYGAVGKTIQRAITTVTGGYIVEMAIPWAQINQTPSVGKLIGADFANDDRDNSISNTYDWKNLVAGGYARPNLWGDITLSATTACTTPILTVAPTSLPFGNVTINTAPADKTYLLTGSNLTANVTVTAQTGYTVSTASGDPFAATATVTQVSGSVNQTIYVRFRPTAVQAYNSNITNASTGATTQNVAMTGAGVGVPALTVNPTSLAYGTVTVNATSTEQTYLLTGSNLTANVTVTVPTGYAVSKTTATGFASSVSVTPASGSVNQTIYVRLTPTAVQAYNGNVSNVSTGATTQNVALTGSGTNAFVAKKAIAAITINGSLSDWATYANSVTFTNATYSNNTVKVSTLWDNTNLYLAYEITDSQIENPVTDPWVQDAVELYIDAGHEKSTTIDANDYQFIITALNSNPVYYYEAAVGKTIQKSVATNGSGYIVEIAIPWAQIGKTPTNGLLMGALFANDDRDGGITNTFDWKNLIESGGYKRPNLWGDIILSDLLKSATIPTVLGTIDNTEKLTVYPNPANEFLSIELEGISGKHQIQIFNSVGSLVKVVELTGSSQVDISELSNGLYFVHLKNHSLKNQKFIKQ